MKALLRIFRPSRKLVIIIVGAALLVGGSGALAVYFGARKYAGVETASADGLECTDINLVTIRKQKQLWIRKYITTAPTDGLTRVKTALRVAQAIYKEQKPDLVQVVVLDKNGPTLRSDIRGRALGADVLFVPDPSKVADGTVTAPYTARYYDGGASDQGLFYGQRIDLPVKDIDGMVASLKDHSNCLDPVAEEAAKNDKGKKQHTAAKDPAADPKADDSHGDGHGDDAHGAETPPAQHPAPQSSQMPPDGKSTGFIGASADQPPQVQRSAAATETSGPGAAQDVAAGRAATDPQTTGASQRHSPVTN